MLEVVQAHMQLLRQVRLAPSERCNYEILELSDSSGAANVCRSCNKSRFPWQRSNLVCVQAFDVNMNPSAAGVPPNGLSTIQGQVSGLKVSCSSPENAGN